MTSLGKIFLLCLLIILTGMADSQEWLEGGYVGATGGSEVAQYFTDPIFYSGPPGAERRAWEQSYYPYFGEEFFRDPRPYKFQAGFQPGPFGVYPYSPAPYYSDFRLNALLNLQWDPLETNWSKTVNYTKATSSVRVYQNGTWITPF